VIRHEGDARSSGGSEVEFEPALLRLEVDPFGGSMRKRRLEL
jgi:hypothetical protein